MSAKRQLFMRLLARGWTVSAAYREVGVSRTTGNNWKRRYKVYRHGAVAGFVPPLDPLTTRPISPRFLSQEERIEIADLRRAGMTVRTIAAALSRSPSTISRELRRNGRADGQYRPFDAHRKAAMKRRRPRPRRIDARSDLHAFVAEHLKQRWSPQQISRELRARFGSGLGMWLAPESI